MYSNWEDEIIAGIIDFEKKLQEMSKEKQKHGELLRQYYSQHGQDPETAIPQKAYLEKLGLSYVAERLEKECPYPEWDGPPLWPLNKYLNFRS